MEMSVRFETLEVSISVGSWSTQRPLVLPFFAMVLHRIFFRVVAVAVHWVATAARATADDAGVDFTIWPSGGWALPHACAGVADADAFVKKDP